MSKLQVSAWRGHFVATAVFTLKDFIVAWLSILILVVLLLCAALWNGEETFTAAKVCLFLQTLQTYLKLQESGASGPEWTSVSIFLRLFPDKSKCYLLPGSASPLSRQSPRRPLKLCSQRKAAAWWKGRQFSRFSSLRLLSGLSVLQPLSGRSERHFTRAAPPSLQIHNDGEMRWCCTKRFRLIVSPTAS